METTNFTWILVVILVLLIVLGVGGLIRARRQRSQRLQERFGPEYDHMISLAKDETEAERELEERIARVEALNIRSLNAKEVDQYSLEWQQTQREFVDEPLKALQHADGLIQQVMKAKGYPVEDFEQRAADISVDYPELVKDYRGLHRIAAKEIKERVTTEDMRQAMVHGRALFESLIKQEPKEDDFDRKEKI
jgi:FtsZ-interacting cell division protein ZipA